MATTKAIVVENIKPNRFQLKIKGDSILETHRFGESALQALRDSAMGKARRGKKPVRNPDAEYKEALYVFGKGTVGFPAIMLKKAMVNACRLTDIPMTTAKQLFFTWGADNDHPDYCAVNHVEPEICEAIVPAGNGKGATLSYRAMFPVGWEAELVIDHLEGTVNEETLVNLLNLAGYAVGIGCQRPERGGQHGRFHVVTD